MEEIIIELQEADMEEVDQTIVRRQPHEGSQAVSPPPTP
jgi:hypothetical protein